MTALSNADVEKFIDSLRLLVQFEPRRLVARYRRSAATDLMLNQHNKIQLGIDACQRIIAMIDEVAIARFPDWKAEYEPEME